MSTLVFRPTLLQLLSCGRRAQAAVRRRNRAVQEIQRHRSRFYEQAWRAAAQELGAQVDCLGEDILEIRLGEASTRVCRNTTALDDPVTLQLAGNKPAVYRLLARRGLPVPEHAEFSLPRTELAIAFLQRNAGPCVVKPASDTGKGDGVTTGVATRRHLAWAAAAAAAFGRDLLIEQQIPGANYRLLYLDGVLLDAVLRRPPTVVGDGRSTIRDLVSQANAERLAQGIAACQVLISSDLDMKRTLARQGLSLKSVPPDGTEVELKTVINENGARDNLPAAHLLCDAIVEAGALAAQAVGVRLAGVDMVTRDPTRPLTDSGGVVLEVNTTPGFYYHYHQNQGHCPVAIHVLKHLFAEGAAVAPCG